MEATAMHLIVVKPFNGFARGDVITDAPEIADILESQHRSFVIRVARRVITGD